MNLPVAISLFGVLAAVPAGWADPAERVYRNSFPAPTEGVTLDVGRGLIEVANGPEGTEVECVVTLRVQSSDPASAPLSESGYDGVFQRLAPRFKIDERRLRMEVADTRSLLLDWDPSLQTVIDVRLTLPKGTALTVRNVAAGLNFSDNHVGDVEVRSDAGSVFAKSIVGDLVARTDSGSITVGEVTGRSELRSDSGLVLAGRLRGAAELRTSVGSVEVQRAFDSLKVRGDHADIILGVSSPAPKSVDIRTSAGSITLNVDENVAASLDASTRLLGRVRVRGLAPVVTRGGADESVLVGALGGGGPPIKLRTSGGNISLVGRAPLDE